MEDYANKKKIFLQESKEKREVIQLVISRLPLDDSYIHLHYAQNIFNFFLLGYNPGEISFGLSSPLWTYILSLGGFFYYDFVLYTIILSIYLYVCSTILWFFNFRLLLKDLHINDWFWAILSFCLMSVGGIVYLSLSGMESVFSIFLFNLLLLSFQKKKDLTFAILCGLLVLTRFEFLGLVFIFILFRFLEIYKISPIKENTNNTSFQIAVKKTLKILCVFLIIILPYFSASFFITGSILPQSFYGKEFLDNQKMGFLLSSWQNIYSYFLLITQFIYFYYWDLNNSFGSSVFCLSVLIVLILSIFFQVRAFMKNKFSCIFYFSMVSVWSFVGQNILSILFNPSIGNYERYQILNSFLIPLMFIAFIFTVHEELIGYLKLKKNKDFSSVSELRKKIFSKSTIICIFILFFLVDLPNITIFWTNIYQENVYHIENVHGAMGRYIEANLPTSARIASFDIGAIFYYSGAYCIDLGGLIDPLWTKYYENNSLLEYLYMKNANYIILLGGPGFQNRYLPYQLDLPLNNCSAWTLTLIHTTSINDYNPPWDTIASRWLFLCRIDWNSSDFLNSV